MDAPVTERATRIVVADDTADIRLMLRIAMASRDDVELVGEATDGHEAIDLVAALRPDLLVLDIGMPKLDGLAALPAIRAASPDTKVVMLTAISTPEHRERARVAGAVAYVEKTTSVRVLVDELLRAAELLDAVLDIVSSPVLRSSGADLAAPAVARQFVTDALTRWGSHDLREVTELLVSELVSNVIMHTGTAPEVVVRLAADRVHVEVSDDDPTPPVPRVAADTDTGGRGLTLIKALALDWGWTPIGAGKVVWFDLAR